MKQLASNSKYATKPILVDDDTYEWASKHKWKVDIQGYVKRNTWDGKNKKYNVVILSRKIMNAPDDKEVDHINLNTFDNRRENLRLCTHKENCFNREKHSGKNKYRGVYLLKRKSGDRWIVKVGKEYLGIFFDIKKAVLAYNKKAVEKYGVFARINHVG
ncbi:MAG: HNH endonuclease [Epsilonproteobacteria bacterium]|nr:HNH endonuclease [Campylobacterota bacterium]